MGLRQQLEVRRDQRTVRVLHNFWSPVSFESDGHPWLREYVELPLMPDAHYEGREDTLQAYKDVREKRESVVQKWHDISFIHRLLVTDRLMSEMDQLNEQYLDLGISLGAIALAKGEGGVTDIPRARERFLENNALAYWRILNDGTRQYYC